LSGNSRIVMIANISPSLLSIEETLNTLKYANRAKNIKIKLKKNIIEFDIHISKYDEVVNALKNEIDDLKMKLQKKSEHGNNSANNTNYDNNTSAEIEGIEKIQKNVTQHFNEEIKLRKEVIETEKKIENNKNEVSELEYQLYKLVDNKEEDSIKKKIITINSENDKLLKLVSEKLTKQSEAAKKRVDLQREISKLTKENSFGGKIIMGTYQYYSTLLDNIILEHRKNVNLNEVKRKDLQLDKLLDQIKERDNFMIEANSELKKKKINFKYITENLKSIEEINIEPLNLPLIIGKNTNKRPSRILNEESIIKKKINHRSYDYEISHINKNIKKDNNFVSKLQKKDKPPTSVLDRTNYSDSNNKIYYVNNNSKVLSNNKKLQINPQKLNVLINNQNDKDNSYDYGKQNMSVASINTSTRIEKEMQRKVKTILKKDIIGRYRKSPYLKSNY
jgi:kinesin family protein 18/19